MNLIRYKHNINHIIPYNQMRRHRRTKWLIAIVILIFIFVIYNGNHRVTRKKSSLNCDHRTADCPRTRASLEKLPHSQYEKPQIAKSAVQIEEPTNVDTKEANNTKIAEEKISPKIDKRKISERASAVLVRRIKVFKKHRIIVVSRKKVVSKEIGWKADYNKRGFVMSKNDEKTFKISDIYEYLSKPWRRNDTNVQDIRSIMNEYVDSSLIVATKENMESGQRIKLYFESIDRSIDVDEAVYNSFPKKWPREGTKTPYRTCSLVGSSGILSDSKCGKQIDSADYVIRMNVPPIYNFTNDAGFKTNMTTMNPSVIGFRYNNLTENQDIMRFLNDMRQYHDDVVISGFSMKIGYDLSINAVNAFSKEPAHPTHFLYVHPKHFLATSHFWKDKFDLDAKRISSGLYMTSIALSMCDEVTAYGFWPFATDYRNRTIEYHYYEKKDYVPLPKVHHFAQEFRILLGLHETGILRLHSNNCYS